MRPCGKREAGKCLFYGGLCRRVEKEQNGLVPRVLSQFAQSGRAGRERDRNESH